MPATRTLVGVDVGDVQAEQHRGHEAADDRAEHADSHVAEQHPAAAAAVATRSAARRPVPARSRPGRS